MSALPETSDRVKVSRRSWPLEEKRRIVEEAFRPCMSVADVARRHGLNSNQVFNWRKVFGTRPTAEISEASSSAQQIQSDVLPAGAPDEEPVVIPMVPGTKVYLGCHPVSMRLGFDGLAARVAQVLDGDPFSGHLFLFRGKRADYLKVLYYDGTGLCLFAKRLESGKFVWPPIVDGKMVLTPAQLSASATSPYTSS